MKAMTTYLKRLGIALSVLLNVILGGESNQTFSARNYARQRDRKLNAVFVIDLLFGKQHCALCWSHWRIRKNRG